MGWKLSTGLREIAGLIDYLNHLVLAKIDLEDYLKLKLLETTDKMTIRSRTDWKQIYGAQWQLISYEVRQGITFVYFVLAKLTSRATIFRLEK